MIIKSKEYILNDKKVVLRTPELSEAKTVLETYKQLLSEHSLVLSQYVDEFKGTIESETNLLRKFRDDKDYKYVFLSAYVNDKYVGSCDYQVFGGSRRNSHCVALGIALLEEYTGFGLGTLLMSEVVNIARENNFEYAKLNVISINNRAINLYKKLGFKECGRLENAVKYDDGSYADNITMWLRL